MKADNSVSVIRRFRDFALMMVFSF
jgi:hypothetical protein